MGRHGGAQHRNGEYILLTRTHVVRVNPKGQEVKSFPLGRNYQYCSFEVLPNGNLLLPLYRTRKVAEMTLDGKEVWSAPVLFPTSARRLPNGNVLATSMNYRKVVELNREGERSQEQHRRGYALVRGGSLTLLPSRGGACRFAKREWLAIRLEGQVERVVRQVFTVGQQDQVVPARLGELQHQVAPADLAGH